MERQLQNRPAHQHERSIVKKKTVSILLLAPHTHAGVLHKKGTELKLRVDQAERLIKAGFAQLKPSNPDEDKL